MIFYKKNLKSIERKIEEVIWDKLEIFLKDIRNNLKKRKI